MSAKGKYNSKKDETKFQIKGADESTKEIKFKLKIDHGSDNATSIKGKAFGQQLDFIATKLPEITIFGEITGEICKSGEITVLISDCNDNRIVEKTLDGDSTYSVFIPSTYSGEKVAVTVHCDEDNDGEFSIGDHVGGIMEWYELQQTNEVNIDMNQELTASIEGEVSCAPYTDGPLYITAWDGPYANEATSSSIGGPFHMNLNEKTSYKILLSNTSPGSELWLSGHWDKDESGVCHGEETVNACDYNGLAASFVLDNVEMTGVNINAYLNKFPPCMVETPQDKYAIDALPGSDTPLRIR